MYLNYPQHLLGVKVEAAGPGVPRHGAAVAEAAGLVAEGPEHVVAVVQAVAPVVRRHRHL